MKKIPTIYKRNPDNMQEILPDQNPVCSWVFTGEGVATRKYDGTSVKIEDGKYYKRREVKKGEPAPPLFAEETHDETTGKRTGWVPVEPAEKGDRWHMEAFDATLPDGTYELCGPKVQGNLENYEEHVLVRHADAEQYPDCPRTYEGLMKFMAGKDIEGIVFHHPDGRMAKIKKRDYKLKRK
jgi:hypothetical protein